MNPMLKSQTIDRSRALEQEETVKVVIRCRPMNNKEINKGMPNIFQLTGEQGEIALHKPEGFNQKELGLETLNTTIDQSEEKIFTFDHAYDE